jgi:hypothetical protein
VWGGELFEDGQVIAKKRKAGRPSLSEVAAREEVGPPQNLSAKLEVVSPISSDSERKENAA